METNNHQLSSDYDNTISLLSIYLSEWSHRDNILWSQVFKFYYAILIVILLPNLALYLKLELPSWPVIVFRLIGLALSFIFLYISLGYSIRLQAIGDTCGRLIGKLPTDYKRKSLYEIKYKNLSIGKIFMPRLSYVICFSLFVSLFSLSIILMIIS